MPRFRYSLASLVGVVVLSSIVFGAWRVDEEHGAAALALIAHVVLCGATVAGVQGAEATRRFWLPFAVFGWGHYLTGMAIYANRPSPRQLQAWAPVGLLTSYLSPYSQLNDEAVFVALNALFTLVFGLIGAVGTRWFLAFRQRNAAPPQSPGEGG